MGEGEGDEEAADGDQPDGQVGVFEGGEHGEIRPGGHRGHRRDHCGEKEPTTV